MHNILLFAASTTPANRRSYDGVFRYAKKARWNVQFVEYDLAARKRRHLDDAVLDVRELLKLWHPDGVIVECAGRPPVLPLADFGNLPIVLLSCHPQQAGKAYPCVYSDDETIALLAARELLALDFADYAFVPYPKNTVWSRERGAAFLRLVKANGKHGHRLGTDELAEGKDFIRNLAKKIAELPKPCGVFAANDLIGVSVVSACGLAGLSVPDDVAVVGVDNDEELCEHSNVTLSSIRIDYETSGFVAAEMLDFKMKRFGNGRDGTRNENRPMPIVALIRRASSNRCRNPRVAKALEHIRSHANERVMPKEISEIMGVSRRFADKLFLSVVGQTVFDVIRQTRIERIKDMLSSSDCQIAFIADKCGYRSLPAMCREFKSVTGYSMREWRKAKTGISSSSEK